MSTLLIDNHDSFTYNLYHLLKSVTSSDEQIDIVKNDAIDGKDALKYDRVVVSPGPGIPKEAGNLLSIINIVKGKIPFLGICLGHQALVESFGGRLTQLPHPIHGGIEIIKLFNNVLFDKIEKNTQVARYHSWVVDKASLPQDLQVIATTHDDVVMAISHKNYPMFGLQFHPESFVTTAGAQMIKNFYQL